MIVWEVGFVGNPFIKQVFWGAFAECLQRSQSNTRSSSEGWAARLDLSANVGMGQNYVAWKIFKLKPYCMDLYCSYKVWKCCGQVMIEKDDWLVVWNMEFYNFPYIGKNPIWRIPSFFSEG